MAAAGAEASQLEEAQSLAFETFDRGIQELLRIAIEGVPGVIASGLSKRNEKLRAQNGSQQAAAEAEAGKFGSLTDQGRAWALACLPGVGLPAALAYPAWLKLRRTALICLLYGHDARARTADILFCFAGVGSSESVGVAVEAVTQVVWAKMLGGGVMQYAPVGPLVAFLADTEGKAAQLVLDTFSAAATPVPEDHYRPLLDQVTTSQAISTISSTALDKGKELAGTAAELGADAAKRGLDMGMRLGGAMFDKVVGKK